MGSGEIAGILTITPTETEEVITHFVVYWGSSETAKLASADAIAEAAITGEAIEVIIPENTAVPADADYLLVYVKNDGGESETGVAAALIDRGSTVTVTLSNDVQNISSFELTVSGVDMDDISKTLTSTETETVLEIPDGTARTFGAIANVNPADPGVFIKLSGTKTANLSAGVSANVTVVINQVEDMKIVIPDYQNNRIVQIDNMAGDSWTDILGADISLSGYFYPFDVDFDRAGKIYFANNYSSTGFYYVYVLDNINDSTPTALSAEGNGIALAVDEINEVVFYSNGSDLRKCALDGSGDSPLSLAGTTINFIRGIDADETGILYIVGEEDTTFDSAIFKYDLSTETELSKNAYVNMGTAWDVIVKGSSVYVANYQGGDNFEILQFDTVLSYVAGYGLSSAMPPSDPATTDFFGPHRFLAIPARKITLIDEDGSTSSESERIVSFDDMAGSSWETFIPSDVSESAFGFFENY